MYTRNKPNLCLRIYVYIHLKKKIVWNMKSWLLSSIIMQLTKKITSHEKEKARTEIIPSSLGRGVIL